MSKFIQALVASVESAVVSDEYLSRMETYCLTGVNSMATFFEAFTNGLCSAGFASFQRREFDFSRSQFLVALQYYARMLDFDPTLTAPIWENSIVHHLSDSSFERSISPNIFFFLFTHSDRFRRLSFRWYVRAFNPLRRGVGIHFMSLLARENPDIWLEAWRLALLKGEAYFNDHPSSQPETDSASDPRASDDGDDESDYSDDEDELRHRASDERREFDTMLGPLALMNLLHVILQQHIQSSSFLEIFAPLYVDVFVALGGLLAPIPTDASSTKPGHRIELFLAAQDEKVLAPLAWCVILLLPNMVKLGRDAFAHLLSDEEEDVDDGDDGTVDEEEIGEADPDASAHCALVRPPESETEPAPEVETKAPLKRFIVLPTLRLLRYVVARVVAERAQSKRLPLLAGVLQKLLIITYSLFPCSLLQDLRISYGNRKARSVMAEYTRTLAFNPDLFLHGDADVEVMDFSWESRLAAPRVGRLVDRYIAPQSPKSGVASTSKRSRGSDRGVGPGVFNRFRRRGGSGGSGGGGRSSNSDRDLSDGLDGRGPKLTEADGRLSKDQLWEKIADVQNWIDHFYFKSDPAFSSDNAEPVPRRHAAPSSSVPYLQKSVLVLKNELLYERFLKNEFRGKFLRLRNTHLDRQNADNSLKVKSRMLEVKTAEVAELQEELRLVKESLDKSRMLSSWENGPFSDEIRRLSVVTEENAHLSDEVEFFKSHVAKLTLEKDDLTRRVDELETEMAATRNKIGRFYEMKTTIQRLQDEIQLWEGNFHRFRDAARQSKELSHEVVYRNEVIDSLHVRLEQLQAKNAELSRTIHQRSALLSDARGKNSQAMRDAASLKAIMEDQRQAAVARIDAVREKYRRVRSLNDFLNKKIFRMQSRM